MASNGGHRVGHRATGHVAAAAVILLIATALAGTAGCYTRVVGARGAGADQYSIEQPYQEDTRLDRWFYGEQRDTRNRSLIHERSVRN